VSDFEHSVDQANRAVSAAERRVEAARARYEAAAAARRMASHEAAKPVNMSTEQLTDDLRYAEPGVDLRFYRPLHDEHGLDTGVVQRMDQAVIRELCAFEAREATELKLLQAAEAELQAAEERFNHAGIALAPREH
jgi:multidrug resistance efflux pump